MKEDRTGLAASEYASLVQHHSEIFLRYNFERIDCHLALYSPQFASRITRLADLVKLIENTRKQLIYQSKASKAVQAAKEAVNFEGQAWQKAKGQQMTDRKSAWQAAVKQEEAEESMRH